MNNEIHNSSDGAISAEEILALNNFYKLHYPSRKQTQAISKASNKLRSKSVISVLQTPSNEQPELAYNPKNSIRKLLASKQLKQLRSQSTSSPQHASPTKYKQNLSFKTILSTKSNPRDLSSVTLPFNNMKEVEELAKKNLNVRIALQRARDQKIKMNKIVMSHKQTQEVKLEYLKTKREEVESLINQEIAGIYEEFFRRQYQAYFGVEEGEDKFQAKLAQLVSALSKRVFS